MTNVRVGIGRIPVRELRIPIDKYLRSSKIGADVVSHRLAVRPSGCIKIAIFLSCKPQATGCGIRVHACQQKLALLLATAMQFRKMTGDVGLDLQQPRRVGLYLLQGAQPREVHLIALNARVDVPGGETLTWMPELRR